MTSCAFLDELRWRGLLHQTTDDAGLASHLASGMRTAYVGFDPTADSLTIGNFIPIKLLMHFQHAGHRPIAVLGGGTGLIGDPSGKSAERQLLTRDIVEHNVRSQRRIFERLLDFSPGERAASMVNNLDWLGALPFIDVLRDVGKHFSVNAMIQRDSVRDRLNQREQGISYTEFSYMILQAYDFLHLHQGYGVTLQMGGSDQWGNIVSGCDLIRRICRPTAQGAEQAESFGLTAPLVTRSDGGKFGKSEAGAIWLSADRTSPYAFYQFWLNTADEDVVRYLKLFTFLSQDEISALADEHERNAGARAAHRALARHMTQLLHGDGERMQAEAAAQALFSGDIAGLSPSTLREALASAPTSQHALSRLSGEGLLLLDVLVETALCKSKREAREFAQTGAVLVNGRKASAEDRLTTTDLLHGEFIALRRGKKNWHLLRFA
ncbi:MAG: tyrosine--tRNA ligase [Myxococcales bacterium]|nr:tyrosine--tRNA ligase [Myxococcales bacterium]